MSRTVSIFLTILLFLLAGIFQASASWAHANHPTTSYLWRTDGRLRTIDYEADTGRPKSITETKGTNTLLAWAMDYYPSDSIRGLSLLPSIPPAQVSTTPTVAITYDPANQLGSWNSQSTSHDLDGNMTTGPVPKTGIFGSFSYDSRNRLLTGGGLTYRYDAEGLRTSITGNAGAGAETTSLVIDPTGAMSKVLSRIKNGVTTRYVYGAGLQYEVSGSGVATYYHYDQAGNTAALTNAAGTMTDRMAYSPYGTPTYRTGTTHTPFLFGGFFGVMTDGNGLLHMRARYYNPLTQRFMNVDPARDGWNWYAYANGNPVNWADPSGFGAISTMQAGLSILGFVPGPIGAVANLVNGFVSMARGDDVGMIQSFTAAATLSLSSVASYGSTAVVGSIARNTAAPFAIDAVRIESNFVAEAANSGVTLADDLAAAATRARNTVGSGSGGAYGTRVHTAFEAEVNGLNQGLSTEISYLNGQVVRRGTASSVRLDVVNGPLNAPVSIFDLKTGSATLTPARIQQIQSHIPGGANVPVFPVRP